MLAAILTAAPIPAGAAQFTVSLEKPAGSVHPLRSDTLEAVLIDNQIYEPLVRVGSAGDIQPVLLESWSYDPAARRFRFKLKEGLRFSDGTPLTSARVIETFRKIIAQNRVQNFSRIKGAPAYASKSAADVAGLKIHDQRSFSIELDVAYPRFLADLADPYASIILENKRSSLPLGTGPYMFREVSPSGSRVVIARNPQAASSSIGFDSVLFTSDRADRADLYLVEPADPGQARLRRQEYLDTEVVFLSFNAANRDLADVRVRRYLGSLLTAGMVDETLGPVAYKVGGYIPFGTAGYNPGLSFPGAGDRPVLPASVSVLSYLPRLTPLAEKYCAALREKGVGCSLKIVSVDEIYSAKADGSLQIVFQRQKSTTYSVEYLLSCFTSQSLCNLYTSRGVNAGISAEMDKLFDRMLRTPAEDKGRLRNLYEKMDAAVLGYALVKPIRYGANKAVWYDRRLAVPPLDTLGPFGMRLGNVRAAD